MIKARTLINKLTNGELDDQVYVCNMLTRKYYPVRKVTMEDECVYLEIDTEVETDEPDIGKENTEQTQMIISSIEVIINRTYNGYYRMEDARKELGKIIDGLKNKDGRRSK